MKKMVGKVQDIISCKYHIISTVILGCFAVLFTIIEGVGTTVANTLWLLLIIFIIVDSIIEKYFLKEKNEINDSPIIKKLELFFNRMDIVFLVFIVIIFTSYYLFKIELFPDSFLIIFVLLIIVIMAPALLLYLVLSIHNIISYIKKNFKQKWKR